MARSTTTKTTARKTTTTRAKAATKPAATKAAGKAPLPRTRKKAVAATAVADAPEAVVVTASKPVSTQQELKKPELIEMVVEKTGVKKRDAKPAIEAALQILGEALAEGRELNLQPLGKIRVNRMKKLSSARVMTCKVRQTIKEESSEPKQRVEAAE